MCADQVRLPGFERVWKWIMVPRDVDHTLIVGPDALSTARSMSTPTPSCTRQHPLRSPGSGRAVPPLHRYYGTLRLPDSLLAALSLLRLAIPWSACVSSPFGRRRIADGSTWSLLYRVARFRLLARRPSGGIGYPQGFNERFHILKMIPTLPSYLAAMSGFPESGATGFRCGSQPVIDSGHWVSGFPPLSGLLLTHYAPNSASEDCSTRLGKLLTFAERITHIPHKPKRTRAHNRRGHGQRQ